MRHIARLALTAAVSVAALAPGLAQAKVHITVDLDHQTMHVEGKERSFDLKVSSGKSGYETPAGQFGVLWMDKDHHSDEYDQAPMPNAIFFAPGYAIHGYTHSPWGHKASHGCIRIPVDKSAVIFDMVKAEGGADVTITGDSPTVAPTVASVEARNRQRQDAGAGAQAPGYYAPDGAQGYVDPGDYAAPERGYTAVEGGYY